MPGLLASAQAGTCGTSSSFIAGCVAKYGSHVAKKVNLSSAIPHFHNCGILGPSAEERWLWIQNFKTSADRNRLRDDRTVIEYERGHALQWVDRSIFGA